MNETKVSIEVDTNLISSNMQSHPSAKGLLNKPFPHFQELTIVFERERATEAGVQISADTMSNDGDNLGQRMGT